MRLGVQLLLALDSRHRRITDGGSSCIILRPVSWHCLRQAWDKRLIPGVACVAGYNPSAWEGL